MKSKIKIGLIGLLFSVMLLATITTASAAITITTPTAYTGCFLHEGSSNTIYGFVAKNLASIQNGVQPANPKFRTLRIQHQTRK